VSGGGRARGGEEVKEGRELPSLLTTQQPSQGHMSTCGYLPRDMQGKVMFTWRDIDISIAGNGS